MANKTDLINKMYGSGKIYKKDAKQYMDVFINALMELLREEGSLTIQGFGKFELKHVTGRMRVDPRNGSPIYDRPHDRIAFKMSGVLKDEWRKEQMQK